MQGTIDLTSGTTVLMVRTATGLVVRGSPGVVTARMGSWELAVDDFVSGTATPGRLERILDAARRDPVEAVLDEFTPSEFEMFALIGPPGVIAGSTPRLGADQRVMVWVEPKEGIVALGLAHDEGERPGWLSLPPGTAVGWGPAGAEVLFDLRVRSVRAWIGDGDITWRPLSASPAA